MKKKKKKKRVEEVVRGLTRETKQKTIDSGCTWKQLTHLTHRHTQRHTQRHSTFSTANINKYPPVERKQLEQVISFLFRDYSNEVCRSSSSRSKNSVVDSFYFPPPSLLHPLLTRPAAPYSASWSLSIFSFSPSFHFLFLSFSPLLNRSQQQARNSW